MQKTLCAILIIFGCVSVTATVQAEGWYFGGKLAYFELDIPNVDDPDNAGLVVGYDWLKNYGIIGIEGEFTTTFEEGNLADQKIEMDTAGVYATYKSSGHASKGMGIYFKVKAGAAYHDLSIGATSKDDTNFSGGVGVGLNMAAVSFELEYTILDSDIDMISLLVRF